MDAVARRPLSRRAKLTALALTLLAAACHAASQVASSSALPDRARESASSPVASPRPQRPVTDESIPANTARSVQQFGIRWTFARPCRVGRFANGDWWVVGPVEIVAIDPPSREVDGRIRNGSMLDPRPQIPQGYDSSMYGREPPAGSFRRELDVALGVDAGHPLRIAGDHSLVSTISRPEPGVRPQLESAAILTVVAAPPLAGSFRPPYTAPDHTVRHRVSDLRVALLQRLPAVGGPPSFEKAAAWFERPWLDHIPGWLGREAHPRANMPDYGRDMSARIGTAALLLQLDVPLERKRALLIRTVQLGIDLWGIVEAGGVKNWEPNGGHASGRKWPILFAGHLLDDAAMMAVGARRDILFGEDAQTFFVEETSPGVFNGGHGGYGPADRGLPEWGIRHATRPHQDNRSLEEPAYRLCCTANAWAGFVLAARVLRLQEAWNHPPLFAYQDRYMAMTRPGTRQRQQDRWTELMWDVYRAEF